MTDREPGNGYRPAVSAAFPVAQGRVTGACGIQQAVLQALITFNLPIKPLAHFDGNVTSQRQCSILLSLTDYLELIDFTGRFLRPDKRGAIPGHLPPILQRLNIDCDTWLTNATQFEQNYNRKFSRRHRNST